MSVQLALAFDIMCILVFIAFIVGGYRKGLLKSFASILVYVLAFLISNIVSTSLSPAIYDNLFKEKLHSQIETKLKDFDSTKIFNYALEQMGIDAKLTQQDLNQIANSGKDTAQAISEKLQQSGLDSAKAQEVYNKFYGYFNEESLAETLSSNANVDKKTAGTIARAVCKGTGMVKNTSQALKAFSNPDPKQKADYIEQTVLRPMFIAIIKIILFVIIFALLAFILKLILSSVLHSEDRQIVRAADKVGGVIVGFVQGCFVLAIVGELCKFLIQVSGGIGDFNASTLNNTYIFRLFFKDFLTNR